MEFENELQNIIDLMSTDQDFRRKAARESFQLFFICYFGHYIKYPFADFHREMFRLAADPTVKTLVVMGARNSAKSTILNTALSIWSLLGAPQKHFAIIASRTQQKSKQHYMNTRKELESNALLLIVPVYIPFFRIIGVLILLALFLRPSLNKITSQGLKFSLVAGISFGVAAIARIYAIQHLGLNLTILILLLEPGLIYLFSYFTLKERFNWKPILGSIGIAILIVLARVLTA